jgi:hypothetical protein
MKFYFGTVSLPWRTKSIRQALVAVLLGIYSVPNTKM